MALIEIVKPRIGVFYTTPEKDAEIQQMINSAAAYFKGAGWDIGTLDSADLSPVAVEAIILYCKMAQNTDPAALTNHPVLISFAAQGRSTVNEAQTDNAG